MTEQKKFNTEELKKVALRDFFHPVFLTHCGYFENLGESPGPFHRLRHTIFVRSQDSVDALITRCDEVWGVDGRKDEDRDRMSQTWETELTKYLDDHELKTVGELASKDVSVFGLFWKVRPRVKPRFNLIGSTCLLQIEAAFKYFGLEAPKPNERYKKELEAARALSAAKRVMQTTES